MNIGIGWFNKHSIKIAVAVNIIILAFFVISASGCEQLPVRDAVDLMEEMREQGCDINNTSISKKRIKVNCK